MLRLESCTLLTVLIAAAPVFVPASSSAQTDLRIEEFLLLQGGQAELVLSGATASSYAIGASTNLVDWIALDEQAPEDIGQGLSTLSILLNEDWPQTFYRVSEARISEALPLDYAGTVSPSGGLISAQQDRVVLEFSGGAVVEDTDIRVSPLANVGFPGVIPSTTYDFGPDGAEFSAPVTLTLSYAEAGLPAEFDATELVIVSSSLVSGELTPVPGSSVDVSAQTITATISGFSTFAIALPNCPLAGDPSFPWCPARCVEPPPPSPDDPGGDLDSAFGTDGIFTFELGLAGATGLDDLLIDPQDRLLLAVEMARMGVARILPDGEGFDTSFGDNGISQLSFSEYDNTPRSVKLRTDGRIILYGAQQPPGGGIYTQIARFLPDGALDTSFGQDGVTLDTRQSNYLGGDLVTLPDGKMLATDPNGRKLYQFLEDGSPDPDFGVDGIADGPAAGPILRRATGDYVVAGGSAILEIDAQGNPGRVFSLEGGGFTATDFQEVPGGGYAVAGVRFSGAGPGAARTPVAARFQPGDEPGTLEPDICFGTDEFAVGFGLRTYGFGGSIGIGGMAVQADGRMVLVGGTTDRGSEDDAVVIRIRPDGDIDAGFGDNGILYLDLGGDDGASSVAIDSQGRIVVAGSSRPATGDRIGFVARLLP